MDKRGRYKRSITRRRCINPSGDDLCARRRGCRAIVEAGAKGRFSRKGRPNEKTCDSTPKTISNFKISRKHDGSSVDHNGEGRHGRGGREWNGVGIEESMKRLADKSRGAAPWLRAHVSQISKLDSSTN